MRKRLAIKRKILAKGSKRLAKAAKGYLDCHFAEVLKHLLDCRQKFKFVELVVHWLPGSMCAGTKLRDY